MPERSSPAAVWAVVVTYQPDLARVAQLLADLAAQVDHVVIVDNASANAAALSSACAPAAAVTLLPLDANRGIAYAQNSGVELARQGGAGYVIFFDQDSAIPPGFVPELRQAFTALSRQHKLAATVPVFQDARHGFFYPLIVLKQGGRRRRIVPDGSAGAAFPVSLAISSGTFTSLAVLADVGPLRNDFFIDYVDTEWCLRALSKGYVLYAVPRACMRHAIGDSVVRLWRWRLIAHSAVRRYYRIRNAFFLLRLRHVPLLLSLREIAINLTQQMIFVLTRKQRRAHLKSLAAGVRDGLFKFTGS